MNNFEKEDGSAIICPYCGAKDNDAWEQRDNSGIITCWEDSCGKKFYWERNTTVEYRTKADCNLNGNEHDFENLNEDWIKDRKNQNEEFQICECKNCCKYVVKKREEAGR